MKYLVCMFFFMVLILFSFSAEGQFEVASMDVLPAAPLINCGNCDVFDFASEPVQKAFVSVIPGNWNSCVNSGLNQWNEPANEENCGSGQFHIINTDGEFVTYYYDHFLPGDPYNMTIMKLYSGKEKTFK